VLETNRTLTQNHEIERICSTGQGEASHGKYTRLQFGVDQAYPIHSSDSAACVVYDNLEEKGCDLLCKA
jgi:hypothetical protein